MNQLYLARLGDTWCRALQANDVPCDIDVTSHFLAGLLDLLAASLTAEPFCRTLAQSVGVGLAVATHAHTHACPASVALLARELPLLMQHTGNVPSDERLGLLLDSFSAGFSEYVQVAAAQHQAGAEPLPIGTDLFAPQLCRPDLSVRDQAVLRELVAGQTNRAIGQALGLSEKAIERRVSELCSKLGLNSRVLLAVFAVRTGLA